MVDFVSAPNNGLYEIHIVTDDKRIWADLSSAVEMKCLEGGKSDEKN